MQTTNLGELDVGDIFNCMYMYLYAYKHHRQVLREILEAQAAACQDSTCLMTGAVLTGVFQTCAYLMQVSPV